MLDKSEAIYYIVGDFRREVDYLRGTRFPFLEILIGVAALYLLYIIISPQYHKSEEERKELATRLNMYVVRVAVENYAAYHRGVFPDSVAQLSDYLESGYLNPYSQEPMGTSQIIRFSYEIRGDNKDNSREGRNGRVRGEPGKVAYGTYIPLGDSVVREYGIIGIAHGGSPLTIPDPAGKELVFVLHD